LEFWKRAEQQRIQICMEMKQITRWVSDFASAIEEYMQQVSGLRNQFGCEIVSNRTIGGRNQFGCEIVSNRTIGGRQ